MNHFAKKLLAAMLAAAALAGCASGSANSTTGRPDGGPDSLPEDQESEKALIEREEAEKIAAEHFDLNPEDTKYVKTELDQDHGKTVYEVEFVSRNEKYEAEIDAKSGQVISAKSEKNHSETEFTNLDQVPQIGRISAKEAADIALKSRNQSIDDAQSLSVDPEEDDGIAVYEVEWRSILGEFSCEVDANSGEIRESEEIY